MLSLAVLRSALAAFSTVFGSMGIFCLYYSFLHPGFAWYALIFLGSASAIVLTAPQK